MNRSIPLTTGLSMAAVAVLGLLAACGGGGGSETSSPAGGTNFKLYVTDAPFPGDLVRSATVVIREVRVHDKDGGGWRTVHEESAEIDLVPLTGGVVSLLTEIELEPGTYDDIRLIVEAGTVVLEDEAFVAGDSRTFSAENGGLHFPSGAQTGIKVKLDEPIVVVTSLSTEVTLDFDLSKNFVFNGSPEMAPGVRRVIFTPVARAVNTTTAGSVDVEFISDAGTPDDETDDTPLSGATVRALDGEGAEAGGGVTDELGGMVIQLAPGTYTIEVEATNHETTTTDPFEVYLGNRTSLGAVTIAATAGEVTGVVMSDGATDMDDSDDVVIAGASVEITLQGTSDPAATTATDSSGAFRFESLPLGTYDIAVSSSGHDNGAAADVSPSLGGTAVAMTLVAQTRNLTGKVTDVDAADVDGATIVVTNAAGVEIGSTTTDANGSYALSLPTGSHEVTITNPADDATNTQALDVEGTNPQTDQVLDVQLPAAAP